MQKVIVRALFGSVSLVIGSVGEAAERIAQLREDARGSPWAGRPVVCYVVPPMSSIKRLPDVIPADGDVTDRLKVVAAKGEFEPVSFMVFPLRDVARLRFVVSDLRGDAGRIPSRAVDVKIVKCWYQAGTAWHSYFADPTQRELVPELLLNDAGLIKVDHKTQDNYLRVDYPEGSEYVWVSYTSRTDPGGFNHAKEPVADSLELMPVDLAAGEGTQFWLTVKVPKTARAGRYRSTITLLAGGRNVGALTLHLRVLPFVLPEPRTYYDLDKTFYASMYNQCSIAEYMKMNGGDAEQASRKVLAEYRNMHDHGCDYPLVAAWNQLYKKVKREQFVAQLEALKKSGLKTKPLFGGVNIIDHGVMIANRDSAFPPFEKRVDEAFAVVKELLGHNDVYPVAWDEPRVAWLVSERRGWKYIHRKGARIMSTSKDKHLIHAGFNEDFSNYGGWVGAESARKWHAIGGRVATYASPHTGPENPDYMRRAHGMALYKADLDGTCNYHYYQGGANIWNEFNKGTFRCFCMVYPTKDDVIDTIAWEGFREAIDDIRYATKLRMLAFEAIGTGDVDKRYAGKIALQWLALLDEKTVDLNAMRLEMINHILRIRSALDGEDK